MIDDIMYFIGGIFMVACVIMVGFIAFDGFNDGIASSDQIPTAEKDFFSNQKDRFVNTWDYGFLFLFVAALAGVLLLSYILQSNPAFFFAFFLLIAIFGGLAGYLANAWISFSDDTILGASISNFPIMNFILSNYLIFVIGSLFLMLIVFFAKPSGGSL